MAEGHRPERRRGFGGRVLVGELILDGLEALLCGVPVAIWMLQLPAEVALRTARVALPLLAAAWVALGMRVLGSLRPVSVLVDAKARQQAVAPAAGEAAQRALARAPRESAALRLLMWTLVGVVGLFAARAGNGDPRLAAALASVLVLHAAGVAGLRALMLERTLGCLRPHILGNLEGIRVFAGAYRFAMARLALAAVGLGHAALALMAWAFAIAPAAALALVEGLLWPTLLVAGPLWARSLRRRTAPIEAYFEATLRSPGTRGPARDEPRAVPAFMAAQGLPYRLAVYLAFSLALAGVAAVAISRRMGALSLGGAGRLLGAIAVEAVGALAYTALAMRRVLAPLMRHIGSRHFLPVARIRSPVGLRPKLLAGFLAVVTVACGSLALYSSRTAGIGGTRPALALAALLGSALALAALVVREMAEPISALEGRSEEMARGELARPVPPSGEADEIGRLMMTFEEMRRSLRDRLRSTESINVDLEREVRRRTEALEQRNAELRDALDKLRRAQDNLVRSEKLASMGRLVAGIAHEINNPVNAVINSLGPLEEKIRQIEGAPDAEAAALARSAEEMLAVVQRGAARTKAIVQALHNYSRGDDAVQREVHLARSVDDSLDLLRHRMRNVKVVKDIDPAARILGLPGQIDQVLMNLLTNATQALGDRGGTIRVAVESHAQSVQVSVSDDGPGIPLDVMPRIFDPFFTTKDVGEGSGLGLSIVHGIVERHGGQVDVHSDPGHGTTFVVTFPRTPSTAARASSQPPV